MKVKKIAITAMIASFTTITSHIIFIPAGFAKIFPVQHFANIVTAVLFGPSYALAQAFIVSLIRNMAGTGSVFAFPGSMIGALLAGWLYAKTKRMEFAFLGEVVGTGFLGAVAAYPLAKIFFGQETAIFGLVPAFAVSSIVGAAIGYGLLKVLMKNTAIGGLLHENSSYHRRL
ncbi:energy coupling factor transporter S component ThiW [Siminovitchia terrae]|uniref:Energy coupling factor transporter S component ThiW n=1 Tax=Siminovitchia terrae TaxID=1914933 RepID=A0A429X5P4_SIMTE|nr:energy coupling factor transporter S component ThiW [Siminovitchia terrae]RST58611.1 energy coupling factor transporter S component ThiW [Siminovitchia terrae]GIN92749.1 energy coupling factor transporter S component ThiW [Siminovitchia terrae]GIN96141.1 energy coupling factor transporter S component ThiW [Siminovitchia terrae]